MKERLRAHGLDEEKIQMEVEIREDFLAQLRREAEEAKVAPVSTALEAKAAPVSTAPDSKRVMLDEMD